MRPALFLLSLLPGAAAHTVPAPALSADVPRVEVQAPLGQAPARLAQRQPGGLPGMREEAEGEGGPGPKALPDGQPGRTRQADPPLTRSLQTPKSPARPETSPDTGE